MHYTRWYDEDDYSRLLMNTLEHVEGETQNELASDIIQLIFQSKQGANLDELINEINRTYLPQKRRWYDTNDTVHSAVEMMRYMAKLLNLKDKEEILKQFCFSLISSNDGPTIKYIEGKN